MIKIKFKNIIQILKKYAVNVLIVVASLYMAPCIYNVFNKYENYVFAESLFHYMQNESVLLNPKSDEHKFIDALLKSSPSLNGFSDSDAYVINNVESYVSHFDNIKQFNILKELPRQILMLNMPSHKRNHMIMEKRSMNLHQMFRNYYITFYNSNGTVVKIRCVNPVKNFPALIMSFIADNYNNENNAL